MQHDAIQQALQWRYATKQFDSGKKITVTDWALLAESLRLAPSSYGLTPWRALVVDNSALRTQLRTASWDQAQVTDCSHFVVFLFRRHMTEQAIDQYLAQVSQARNVEVSSLSGYREIMVGDLVKGPRSAMIDTWASRQAYIALGFLLETAALLKIDACPMEGFDPKVYDQVLGLQDSEWASVVAAALGYRHPDDKYQHATKVRFPLQTLLEYR